MTYNQKGVDRMVREGKGSIFRRADGKYLIYLPVGLAEDSMFPFNLKEETRIKVKVSFKIGEEKLLLIEELEGDIQ